MHKEETNKRRARIWHGSHGVYTPKSLYAMATSHTHGKEKLGERGMFRHTIWKLCCESACLYHHGKREIEQRKTCA